MDRGDENQGPLGETPRTFRTPPSPTFCNREAIRRFPASALPPSPWRARNFGRTTRDGTDASFLGFPVSIVRLTLQNHITIWSLCQAVYRPGYAPGPAPSQGGVQLLHQRQGG